MKVSLKVISILLFLLGVILFFIDYEAAGVIAAIVAFLIYPSSYKRGRRYRLHSKSYAHGSYIDLDEGNESKNDTDWNFDSDGGDSDSNSGGSGD